MVRRALCVRNMQSSAMMLQGEADMQRIVWICAIAVLAVATPALAKGRAQDKMVDAQGRAVGACTAFKAKYCGGPVKGYPSCLVSHAAETSPECHAQISQHVPSA